MTQTTFDAFYQWVLEDPALQVKLRELTEREAFIQGVVALGQAHGYCFSAEAVTMTMQANRRAWLERWIR
jgi:hypothetical protein